MRKLALAAVAAGLLGATSLTPVLAASTDAGLSSELSAQKMKKKKMKMKRKMRSSDLGTDLSAQKMKKKKMKRKMKGGMSSVITYRIAA